MIKLLSLLVVLSVLTGCTTFNKGLAEVVRELAKDTNTVHIRITSPTFGTFELDRNVAQGTK